MPDELPYCPRCGRNVKVKLVAAGYACENCEQVLVSGHPEPPAHEQAATGAVRSKLYPPGTKFPARYDLMFRNAAGMRRLAETWGEGFAKYGADNWMKGFPASVFVSHALEHFRLYLAGDRSEDHLAHIAWNALALCWVEENKPELLDLTMPVQVCFSAGQDPEPKQ